MYHVERMAASAWGNYHEGCEGYAALQIRNRITFYLLKARNRDGGGDNEELFRDRSRSNECNAIGAWLFSFSGMPCRNPERARDSWKFIKATDVSQTALKGG